MSRLPPPTETGDGELQVTVVVPTHNRWPLLKRTLASVLGQESVRFEVVVVDDGSSDETPLRLAEFTDPRVRTHRHPVPKGVAHARNAGLQKARAPWVAFIDDDDLWSPRKLEYQLDAITTGGATWAYGASMLVDEQLSIIYMREPPNPRDVISCLRTSNVIPGSCSDVMASAAAVRQIDGFDPNFPLLADYDFFLRLSQTGPAAVYPGREVACLLHSGNMSLNEASNMVAEFDRLRGKHAAAGTMIEAAPMWRWIAYQLYRRGNRRASAQAYLKAALRERDPPSILRALVVILGPGATEKALHSRYRRRTPSAEPEWLDAFRAPASA